MNISASNWDGSYQWLDCNNAYEEILGETYPDFSAFENGSYAVKISENGCVDTSACVEINTVDLSSNKFGASFSLYPNPTSCSVNIDRTYNDLNIIVRNLLGQITNREYYHSAKELDFTIKGEPGIYLIEIMNDQESTLLKVVKK